MNIVLPAAGKGTRLGLPYPKEIHRVSEGISLIDFSLAHVEAAPHIANRVTLTIVPEKQAVVDFVRSRLPNTEICTAHFDDRYTEWPGSILSAQSHFAETNVVLLPDSRITILPGAGLLHRFRQEFEDGADVVFAYLPATSSHNISALGALSISETGAVIAFCDKPAPSASSKFNAFWSAFGFTDEVAEPLLNMMMRSVAREEVDILSIGCKVTAFPVADYVDLGTWPNIRKFQASQV